METHDLGDDGQSQPGRPAGSAARAVGPIETLEQPRKMAGLDPTPLVRDMDGDLVV